MYFLKLLFVGALVLSCNQIALARGQVGNGGGMWACKTGNTIQWTTLVDLFEGRKVFGLQIQDNGLSMEALIDRAERNIFQADQEFYKKFSEALEEVRRILNVRPDLELFPTDDFKYAAKPAPETCAQGKVEPLQLATFTPDGLILVDERLWIHQKMSELDRAALYLHEAIYLVLRNIENAQDSRKARKIVGHILSNAPVSSYMHLFKLQTAPPPNSSPTPGTKLYQWQHAQGDWTFTEMGKKVIMRVAPEGENRLKISACKIEYYYPDQICVATKFEFYTYLLPHDLFVKAEVMKIGFQISHSNTDLLYVFYNYYSNASRGIWAPYDHAEAQRIK